MYLIIDKDEFADPAKKYRPNPIVHNWPQNRGLLMDAIKAYGFGGVVTNVPAADGWVANPDNIEKFRAVVSELKDAGLSYWI